MLRIIIPVILISLSIALFFTFTNPLYNDVKALRQEVGSYNEALNNSKALENERDKLTQKYNSIGGENLDRLEKLLPESIDNIRLILEIEKLAQPYGMALKNVKYDTTQKVTTPALPGAIQGVLGAAAKKDYRVWNLEFSTEGSYDNFINFAKDIENNLRIVDIASISFSSSGGILRSDLYEYNFKIKTYWLKN